MICQRRFFFDLFPSFSNILHEGLERFKDLLSSLPSYLNLINQLDNFLSPS